MSLDHLNEDPQPAALWVRSGSGGSGLPDSQLHCTSPVPRPSPLGCTSSGPLLTASAGPSAHLFPSLCLLYLCGLCPWKKILALTRRVKPGWGCLLVLNGTPPDFFLRAFAREQLYSNADFRPFWCCFWEYHPRGPIRQLRRHTPGEAAPA